MLVICLKNQLVPPNQICRNCLFADQAGQPRWDGDRLKCGHAVHRLNENQPEQFECEMGFRVMHVD